MKPTAFLSKTSPALQIAAAYAVWLVTIALSAVVVWIWRSALLGLFIRLRLDKYAYAAYNNVVVLALVIGWLVLVIVSEAWCRQSAQKGRLAALVLRLDGTMAALIAIGFVLYQVGL